MQRVVELLKGRYPDLNWPKVNLACRFGNVLVKVWMCVYEGVGEGVGECVKVCMKVCVSV